jgi:hypothetical protein
MELKRVESKQDVTIAVLSTACLRRYHLAMKLATLLATLSCRYPAPQHGG